MLWWVLKEVLSLKKCYNREPMESKENGASYSISYRHWRRHTAAGGSHVCSHHRARLRGSVAGPE